MCVQQNQKIFVLGAIPGAVADFRGGAVQEHAERAHPAAVLPILGAHPLAVCAKPDDVLVGMRSVGVIVVKGIAVEIRVLLAVLDHALGEIEKSLAAVVEIPVIPRELTVLTI